MKTDTLVQLGAVVTLILSGVLSGIGFTASDFDDPFLVFTEAQGFGAMGLLGVVASGAVIWSARRQGRWGWVALILGLPLLGVSVSPPLFIGAAHTYGVIALFIVWLAVVNALQRLDPKKCFLFR